MLEFIIANPDGPHPRLSYHNACVHEGIQRCAVDTVTTPKSEPSGMVFLSAQSLLKALVVTDIV